MANRLYFQILGYEICEIVDRDLIVIRKEVNFGYGKMMEGIFIEVMEDEGDFIDI